MISAFAPNQPRSRRLAVCPVISQCNFECRIYGLGAAVSKEDAVERFRHQSTNFGSQFECSWVANLKCWPEVQFACCRFYSFHNLRPTMPRIYAPKTGCSIEDISTIFTFVVHPTCTDEQARGLLKCLVGSERHPKCGERIIIYHAPILLALIPNVNFRKFFIE